MSQTSHASHFEGFGWYVAYFTGLISEACRSVPLPDRQVPPAISSPSSTWPGSPPSPLYRGATRPGPGNRPARKEPGSCARIFTESRAARREREWRCLSGVLAGSESRSSFSRKATRCTSGAPRRSRFAEKRSGDAPRLTIALDSARAVAYSPKYLRCSHGASNPNPSRHA